MLNMANLKIYKFFLLFFLIIFYYSNLSHASLSGYQIMQKVDKQNKVHKNQHFDIKMLIIDKNKNKKTRYFSSKKKHYISNKKNKTNNLIKFYAPATIKHTGLLTITNNTKNDIKQWIYLPAFKATRIISSSKRNSSFMGSDFNYRDISGRVLKNDTFKLIKTDSKYYYIESRPKSKIDDDYGKINYIIDKNKFFAVKVIYFNNKMERLKSLTNSKIVKINGVYVAKNSLMKNILTGGKTYIYINNINFNVNINDYEVDIKGLKND